MLKGMAQTHLSAGRPILDRFGQALRKLFAGVLDKPVPERWADLLDRLNSEESAKGSGNKRAS